MASLSMDKAAALRQWLFENYSKPFDLKSVNDMFQIEMTSRQLYQIYRGRYVVSLPRFSFFRAPVRNVTPYKDIDLLQLFQAITGTHYKALTNQFRDMPKGNEKAEFKTSRFDNVTFAGTFATRKTDAIKQPSGYVILDFDHVPNMAKLKNLLIHDAILSPEMIFTSPSGDGLKVVVFNTDAVDYPVFYQALVNYLTGQYPEFAASLDRKTKDISRTCFICHDADAYIKPQYQLICQAYRN